MKKRILIILFWSVIAAAFIGPGTLVTASTAGAQYGLELAWTLVFATIACIIFQEMAARLTIVTGKDLATTLSSCSPVWLVAIIPFGVVLGCLAYEAGNLLGASIGLQALFGIPASYGLLATGALSILLISLTSVQLLVRILGSLVAVMGVLFFYLACQAEWTIADLIANMIMPSVPAGSEWVVLALIGTTVVPYNLFLGSGLGESSSLSDMRMGIIVSVILGGLVSLAVLLTGTLITGGATLLKLVEEVNSQLGEVSSMFVGAGIFAAGLTSAITAPLAAGFIVNNFFSASRYNLTRITAMTVIMVGMIMGFLDVRPESLILAAQAANGLALPLVAAFLWVVTNHTSIVRKEKTSFMTNILTFGLMNVLVIIGFRSLIGVFTDINGVPTWIYPMVSLVITIPLSGYIVKVRGE